MLMKGIYSNKPNFSKRWLPLRADPHFKLAQMTSCFPPTPQGLADGRGFVFGDLTDCVRNTLENLRFENCDFGDSSFRQCNLRDLRFSGCVFEGGDFTGIGVWDTHFQDCRFRRCVFTGQIGVDSSYAHCKFDACTLSNPNRGIMGGNTQYLGCRFAACKIKSAHLCSLVLRDCRFDSILSSVRFMGAAAAAIRAGGFPVQLINCDFSGSRFDKVIVDYDCEAENTLWPAAPCVEDATGRIYGK